MQNTSELIQSALIGFAPPWTRRIPFPHTIVARRVTGARSLIGNRNLGTREQTKGSQEQRTQGDLRLTVAFGVKPLTSGEARKVDQPTTGRGIGQWRCPRAEDPRPRRAEDDADRGTDEVDGDGRHRGHC